MPDNTHESTADEQWNALFEEHRELNATITSNAADGATIDVNGTELLIKQNERYVPNLVEIWVENENAPLGAINIATGQTVTLGGIEESLATRVDEILELPIEEIPTALEELAYRLNPAGRQPPESLTNE